MASEWRLCGRCHKVKPRAEFPDTAATSGDEAGEPVCANCLNRPARAPRTRTRVVIGATEAAEPAARPQPRPLTGRGDREARAARARAVAQRRLGERHDSELSSLRSAMRARGRGPGAALSELSERHAEEYAELLESARAAEGL